MKRHYIFILLAILTLFSSPLAKGQSSAVTAYHIPVAGNAFEIGHSNGRSSVSNKGVHLFSQNTNPTNIYFKVLGKGKLIINLKGKANADSKVNANFLGKDKILSFKKGENVIRVGQFDIKSSGYYHIDLTGVEGRTEIEEVIVSGSAIDAGIIYCNDPAYYYWARRGPSCHLGYTIPSKGNVLYYYNEVVVPVGEDKVGSYYMANGFGQGYFGIQVNSETERRILFSVWSPFKTDDPKSIPVEDQIVLLKKGDDVHVGSFGNEGSGGQSYLKYNWKAGIAYKFLLKGEPDGNGNTAYTAWFSSPEFEGWRLIASFKRPKTDTYLTGFHSFLENFNPNQGYLTRQVNFNNQWVYDGAWKKVESARFTVDGTYAANQRVDAIGGETKDGYFLKMGGFFNEVIAPNTIFKFENNRPAPRVDFDMLP